MKKLKDTIPTLVTSGIFANITNPMWSDDFNADDLDLQFASRYGQKWISPLIEMLEDADGEVKGANLVTLANSIYRIRAVEWGHLYDDLKAEYDPIENTDYTETESITRDTDTTNGNTRTLNTTQTVDADNSTSSSGTTTVSGSGASNKYGFDSVAAVGDTTASDSSTTTASTTATSSADSSTRDTGTVTDAGTGSVDESVSRSLRKHGNIGVMTNVQLLRDDTDFWKWSFIDVIFEDVAKMITLAVY